MHRVGGRGTSARARIGLVLQLIGLMRLILAFPFHMKGLGIWIGLAFGLLVAAASMLWRFWYLSRDR